MTQDTAVKTVWSEAIRLIEERGWYHGAERVPPGSHPVCLWTAVSDAAIGGNIHEIADVLKLKFGVPYLNEIFDWNDHPTRTVEDVYAVLWELHQSHPIAYVEREEVF